MATNNRYIYHARISEAKFRQIVKLFCLDLNAVQIAEISHLSRNSINKYLKALRERIVELCDLEYKANGIKNFSTSPSIKMQQIPNEKPNKKNNSAIFGIIHKDKHIYTQVLPNFISDEINQVLTGKKNLTDLRFGDLLDVFDCLVDIGHGKYLLINGKSGHGVNSHRFNSVEGFFGYSKQRLLNINYKDDKIFKFHLKESEFRFNNDRKKLIELY